MYYNKVFREKLKLKGTRKSIAKSLTRKKDWPIKSCERETW